MIRLWFRFGVGLLCVAVLAASISYGTPVTTNLVLQLKSDAGVVAIDHDADSNTPDVVNSWTDQSTQTNDVAQGGADTLKPQLITGISNGFQTNPFSALRFDGTDDVLSRTAAVNNLATNTSGGTIFLVSRTPVLATNQVAFAYGTGDANRVSMGMATGTNWNVRTRIASAGASGSTATVSSAEAGGAGVPLVDTFYVQAAIWDGTTAGGLLSKLLLYDGTDDGVVITGADTGTAAAGAFAPTALHVGRLVFAGGAGTSLQGDITELLIYNDNLSAEDQASVFTYLGQKYGVLPVPEPSALSLIGISICSLVIGRRMRRS
jgi:hypothetical protein